MMSDIKPIETIYDNCRFRSRTEARWAVFFNSMGIEWMYEWEGYEIGSGAWYLPDFYLPKAFNGRGAWVEIKPMMSARQVGQLWYENFTDEDFSDFSSLAALVNDPAVPGQFGMYIMGQPGMDSYQIVLLSNKDSFGAPEESYCELANCDVCGAMLVGHGDYWYDLHGGNCRHFYNRPALGILLKFSLSRAQQSRFEYGETPSVFRRGAQ